MVIGIDIRVLGNKFKTGIEEYTEQLLGHLLPLDPEIQYKLFYSSFSKKLPEYPWLSLPNVKVYKFKWPNKLIFLFSRLFNYPKIDKMIGGCDVFFSPHFFIAALSPQVKRVTTFHDLSFVRFPEFFPTRKKIWHRYEMKPEWQSKFSDKVIAVSESTRNDLSKLYSIDPAKIFVVPSGISASMYQISEQEKEKFRKEKNLPPDFIFFLGTLEPRKNIIGLIRAFNKVKEDPQFKNLNLVIAGSKGWLYKDIFKEQKKSNFENQIHFIGHLDDKDKVFYYNLSLIFVYPSFFEGFGFPPLEAMACGVPVITSNRSSLPEVVGSSGILIDPYSSDNIAFAIKEVLTDKNLRNLLIKRGFNRVAQFSWANTAKETLKVISSSK